MSDVTSLLDTRLDHIMKEETCYLPQRDSNTVMCVKTRDCITVMHCHSCSLWAFIILECPIKCHYLYVNSLYLAVKKNLNIHKEFWWRHLGKLEEISDFLIPAWTWNWILPAVKWSNMVAFNSLWIHIYQCLSMCGCSQYPGLSLLFLNNTKHKDILNIIIHCNKQITLTIIITIFAQIYLFTKNMFSR